MADGTVNGTGQKMVNQAGVYADNRGKDKMRVVRLMMNGSCGVFLWVFAVAISWRA
jgi:hypothetical protein